MPTLPPAQLNIGPAILPDFMSSIFFYCMLAWPTSEEMAEFHRVSDERIAGHLRSRLRSQPEYVAELRRDWPQWDWDRYVALATSKRRTSEGRLRTRLTHRMTAALIGIGILHKELPDAKIGLPKGWTDVSLDRLCAFAAAGLKIKDPENVEKLVWRPSLPIIHVAIATQLQLTDSFGVPESNISIDDVDFVRLAMERAETYLPIIAGHPLFAPTDDQRTEIRWHE